LQNVGFARDIGAISQTASQKEIARLAHNRAPLACFLDVDIHDNPATAQIENIIKPTGWDANPLRPEPAPRVQLANVSPISCVNSPVPIRRAVELRIVADDEFAVTRSPEVEFNLVRVAGHCRCKSG